MMLSPLANFSVEIKERSQISVARYRAQRLARMQGMSDEAVGRLALVVTEAATNLLVHAQGGEILLTAAKNDSSRWVEMLALDQGPGIARLNRALAGGNSTGQGLGEGLGAIQRLSDEFEIFAPPGAGTAITSRFYTNGNRARSAAEFDIGAMSRSKRGETICGDGWSYRGLAGEAGLLLVVDGLGHGRHAHQATKRALETLAEFRSPGVGTLLVALHDALDGTRGAAAAAALLDPAAGKITFCGIGNISATLITAVGRRGLVSLNGTLGFGSIQIQEFTYDWLPGALLLLHTDGISSRWDFADYPGLRLRDPSLISAVIYRDHASDRDDATAVALRRRRIHR